MEKGEYQSIVRLNTVFNYIFSKQISPSSQFIMITLKIKIYLKKFGSRNGTSRRLFLSLAGEQLIILTSTILPYLLTFLLYFCHPFLLSQARVRTGIGKVQLPGGTLFSRQVTHQLLSPLLSLIRSTSISHVGHRTKAVLQSWPRGIMERGWNMCNRKRGETLIQIKNLKTKSKPRRYSTRHWDFSKLTAKERSFELRML